jgi:outer membrane protein assembly factor BamB
MFETTSEPLEFVDHAPVARDDESNSELRQTLLGTSHGLSELPALADLVAAVIALASGSRRKVRLPLGRMPAELTLVRAGGKVLVDCYSTESAPEVLLRERPVELSLLLTRCAEACDEAAVRGTSLTLQSAMRRLALRLRETPLVMDAGTGLERLRCTGGSLRSPGPDVALAFGFGASIAAGNDAGSGAHAFADVHALLFQGQLWAFAGDRRLELAEGPIMLCALRMVSAMRALVDAWQADRALHVRLQSGRFSIGVRRTSDGEVTLTFRTVGGQLVSLPAFDVAGAALPVLRLASDLTRRLIGVDRGQAQNLRLTALRRELRELRRLIRARNRVEGFQNQDPERLRISSPEPLQAVAANDAGVVRGLRYTERWSAEIDALDANAIFLCGDRMIVTTHKLTLALSRDDGGVLWSRPTARATTLMAERALVRLLPGGAVELCDVQDGNVYARTRLQPRVGGVLCALFAGGGDTPPVVILSEGRRGLVAIDLRTGEPRWRYRAPGEGALALRRSGRVLLVTSGGGCIDALDTASGEPVWRFGDRVRFCLRPTIDHEIVVAAAGEPGGGGGSLYGIELYSGRPVWQQALGAAPNCEPVEAGGMVVVAHGSSRDAQLTAYDSRSGEARWSCADPGLDHGGHALPLDDGLLVNTSRGRVSLLDLTDGHTRWSRALSNPLTDDVPRQLAPLLRQGALFVPSAQVHVLRPSDGTPLAQGLNCDLVPDFLGVDERGGFYVAEESGHLRAYAAAPHLSLVR